MIALALPFAVKAQSLPMVTVQTGADGTQTWSLSIQILLLMTALTLLPAILLMMTSFTRIIIVLSFMRQAIGSAQTPPNQVLLGLSLFLTAFIMSPVLKIGRASCRERVVSVRVDLGGRRLLKKKIKKRKKKST